METLYSDLYKDIQSATVPKKIKMNLILDVSCRKISLSGSSNHSK
jgi:hypothetical protein